MSDDLPKNEVLCPSCHQWTDGRYTDGRGKRMRACGFCMIQWEDAGAIASPIYVSRVGEKGIEGRARELLEIGKSLVELDEEANSLGTDSWAWLRQVEDFLAASSQVEPLLTMEALATTNPASAQASLESLKLEVRKRAFDEAAEHEPSEYLGCRGYDWECRCGTCGVWRGATNWPERIRWPDHIRSLASAPAVPAEEKK